MKSDEMTLQLEQSDHSFKDISTHQLNPLLLIYV